MSASEISPLADSPGIQHSDDGPVFAAPWEAKAFAMAVRCHEQGIFSWPEWAEALSATIRSDPHLPYYEQWLLTLEKILSSKETVSEPERLQRVAAWDRAAKATPHGEAIELGRDQQKPS